MISFHPSTTVVLWCTRVHHLALRDVACVNRRAARELLAPLVARPCQPRARALAERCTAPLLGPSTAQRRQQRRLRQGPGRTHLHLRGFLAEVAAGAALSGTESLQTRPFTRAPLKPEARRQKAAGTGRSGAEQLPLASPARRGQEKSHPCLGSLL